MTSQSPFLDISSFEVAETVEEPNQFFSATTSPFLSIYESGDYGGGVPPETEEYVSFVNELYDDEFDEALYMLANEAASLLESRMTLEEYDENTTGLEAERLLTQHFAPLINEVEMMLGSLATEFNQEKPTDEEFDSFIDRYQPSIPLTPAFENFWGKLKKAFKKVAKKVRKYGKTALGAVATGGLSLVLNKLKPLIKPLLKRVIQFAIGKLPTNLQPIARKLSEKLPFLKEIEDQFGTVFEVAECSDVARIQHEFNQNVATLLFASTEPEQDLEVARILNEQQESDSYPIAELERARNQFIERIQQLKEGEDPSPYIESFIPAILPALKIGIRLIGRKRVVNFLAKLLAKLVQKFVGPQYAVPLSRAIVSTGLGMLSLENAEADSSGMAANAIAATVEEAVCRVAAAPEHVFEDLDLLEGFTLEAFEQAAATNLPPVLPEETYRQRPDLAVGKQLGGFWMRPHGRGGNCKFKKFSRAIPLRVTPNKLSMLESFNGVPLDLFLEEQMGVAPGEEVEAALHLFEATPGMRLFDIPRQDEEMAKLNLINGYEQLHPLSNEAAGLLLGIPEAGRVIDLGQDLNNHTVIPGQRFYHLEIPGRRPLSIFESSGRSRARKSTRIRVILDFPANEIRLNFFLSEIRAQDIAVKLRQKRHIGVILRSLHRMMERGLLSAAKGRFGRLKIIHEAVSPDQWLSALKRLPGLVFQNFFVRLTQWATKGVSEYLKKNSEAFIAATEDSADGVTCEITLGNPPGFPQLRQTLKGKGLSLASLKVSDGEPTVKIKVTPGYVHE